MFEQPLRILLYAEQDYAFAILRPLQQEALSRGYAIRWLVVGNASSGLLEPGEERCQNVRQAIDFAPDVVFAPGDRVPGFIPGLKVQVFHGLNEDKRGNIYPERGLFDLYCTEGPARTQMLQPLAEESGTFRVAETGWVKLDTLFSHAPATGTHERPQIVFASTFTPRLSAAEALAEEIGRLSRSPEWQWFVTLHPKMAAATVARYRALENDNLRFCGTAEVIDLLHRGDVLVGDNSSVLQEFLLLEKPVVTYRNRAPGPFLIDIRETDGLESAIRRALNPDAALLAAIRAYGPSITPWRDGKSAARVLDAAEAMLAEGWQSRKPANFFRNLKMRRQLNYFGL